MSGIINENADDLLSVLPESLAKAVVQQAHRESRSISTTLAELVQAGLLAKTATASELDEFIGSWEDDPEFDEAMAAFEMIDENLWR